MTDQTKAPEKPVSAEQQWPLALAYLSRAEKTAHVLRGMLFAGALAMIALVLTHMKGGGTVNPVFFINAGSVVCSVAAIFCLVKSWQLQKEKAIERFKFLKAKDADAVVLYDGIIGQLRGLQGRFWDWLAFWALALAILIQIGARTMGEVTPLIAPFVPPPPPPPQLPPLNL
jgi:hypothetical protein